MLLNVLVPLLFLVICLPILISLYGVSRWQAETVELRDTLEASRTQMTSRTYDTQELVDLPAPVRRFFQAVLTPGQPLVALAEIKQEGQFNLSQTKERWAPFSSTQIVVTQGPGFDWDARIRRAPGLQLFVHDAYVAGVGWLKAALFGLLSLVEQRGPGDLARGELIRFLAEAVWYPTKLLPSQGVQWHPIDEDSARATLVDGESSVSLTFGFDQGGMIRTVAGERPYRAEDGALVETAWEGRFWEYQVRSGMRIPVQGEAAWLHANGRLPYWRGRVTDILYKFAP